MQKKFLELLQCPLTGQALIDDKGTLITSDGNHRYLQDEGEIPLFSEQFCSSDARIQQQHYDRIATKYLENLSYPHTIEYTSYLDHAFLRELPNKDLGISAEICCGHGEAFQLVREQVSLGIGIDISVSMLRGINKILTRDKFLFAQGDATMLPLRSGVFDSVLMFGGIHHVPDRQKLFNEVFRILKPGGTFIWREPVSDFFIWKWLRLLIYRISPTLDHKTERPLTWRETVPPLQSAGFTLLNWKTYGFFGFCLFMNSDVLIFNQFFRFIPGIKKLVRLSVQFDDRLLRLRPLRYSGLRVIGVAQKPV